MATPTLTNLTTDEQYRTSFLDLTDMVVSGSGTIAILMGINPDAGTLDYLPASSGNVTLNALGLGQYLLMGTAEELTTSLANLAFFPTAGFFGTFELVLHAENSEGPLDGSKTFSFDLTDGDAITLGDGTNDVFLLKSVLGTATVDGGTGQDTLLVEGSNALTIDFSQVGQQVTSGSPTVEYSNFENLDAQAATGVMTVTASSAGGTLLSGSANDSITLGAGLDVVDAGDGNDQVQGAWSAGDDISLGDGNDSITFSDAAASVNGGAGTDTLVVNGSTALRFDFHVPGDNAPETSANLSNFENLDASGASGAMTVSLASGSTLVQTGSGDDTIAFRNTVASVNAGAGRDTLELSPAKLSAPDASAALSINLAASNANQVTSGAPAGASWQNFEDLDGSAWDKNLTVTANAAGSVIATGSGADTVVLGSGADQVDTGSGNDVLIGAPGNGDNITLGAGNDTATFASNAVGVASGGADVDTLLHSGGAVTINLATNSRYTEFENLSAGNASGAVTFTGVAGTTAVTTGAGNDVINVAAAVAGVSISAGAGNNTITGGAGDDSITLGAGIDNIRGGGGNDVVRGNLSVGDRVLLDGGDDTITLPTTAIAVTVDGGAGSDTLVVRGSAAQTFNFAASDDNGTLAGSYKNFENVSGAAASGALTVTGVALTTLVVTGRGADVINVAAATQGVTINAGNGTNTVTGSAFNDTITLGTGKDVINAGGGSDTVNGALTAGDQILLQAGADTFLYRALSATGTLVDGGTGIDTLQYTGSTAKTFNFSAAADNVAAETGAYKAFENLDASTASGAVTVTSAATTNRIVTGSGADIITATNTSGGVRVDAGAGNDRVTTGSGADTIVYSSDADIVDAGAGIDKLEVGAGAGELTVNFSVSGSNNQVDSLGVYRNFENLDGAAADSAINVLMGAQTNSVVTGSGDDTVRTSVSTTVTGTISLGAGDDTVLVTTTNTNLAAATLTGVEQVALGDNVDATLSIAQNALLDSAAGTNTVTLAAAGTAVGAAEVETYRLANGVNHFTLGAQGQNVTGGSGNDTVSSDALTILSGTLALGAGTDTLVIDTTATDLSALSLSGVETIALAADVNASMTVAQNALLGNAAGSNAVILTDAGTTSGAAQVEIYQLAAGTNTFTLGAAAQNVVGASGDDTFRSGSQSSVSGILDGVSGDDTLVIDNDTTLTATLNNIDVVSLADGVDLITNIATANLIGIATGTNSVTLTDAGVLTGAAAVETYHLAAGGNDFTLGASAQNVTGGSGDDVFNSDALTSVTGTLVGGGGHDVLNIQSSMQLTAVLTDIDTITIASNADLTTNIAGNALLGSAAGSNFVTLVDAGVVTGAQEIEAYRLADGGNTFTLGNASQTVIGGSGDDIVHTAAFTTLTGTFTLGAGDDTVVVDTTATDMTGATLSAVEHIALANDVDVTVTLAQNALLGSALGNNTVTLNAAGTASGAAAVESYQLADGANTFTLGAAAQNVAGGTGGDVVHSGAVTAVSGTLNLGGGDDTLVVDTSGTNISTAALTLEHIELGNNVSVTMTVAQSGLLVTAAGTNTVTFSDEAANILGTAEVENYQLADGGNGFTLAAATQNVTGGSGADDIHTGALSTVSGTLDGAGGNDTVVVDASATLSASLQRIEAVNLANNVNLTTNLANNTLLAGALGTNTVTLNEAGVASGAAAVENYVLADGSNSFTLGAAAQNVSGGTGDDTVLSAALSAVSGVLALGGGNDKLVVTATGTNISAATLTSVEAVELLTDVSITSSIANNALLGSALGTNTVSLSDAGSASGAAQVENYVLANGSNTFTLGAAAQNVTGGSGDDTLDSGALTTVSGVLDGVSGNDVLHVSGAATVSAILNNIDAVTLANNVNLTTNLANNALLTIALGNNTVTLSEAGTASGAAQVESYVLATGTNTFTLGADAQNVTGGSGDDSLRTGALTTVSGSLDGVSGNDTLTVEQSANLSASLSNIDAVTLANNVNLTTTLANNALITSALGTNTVTLSEVGTASGAAQVESYVLSNGSNDFTLGATAQNVTGGSGNDTIKTGALTTVSGNLDGVSGTDTVAVEQSGILSATLSNIDAVTLANNVNLTTTIANNALIGSALGTNTVTLSAAGTASGVAEVENYQLADGANSFTLGATAQNVTGGSGDDVVRTGAVTTVTGAIALAGGSDTLVIDTSGTHIAAAVLTSVETIQLANNVNASMSIAQNVLLGSAAGSNTVTLTDAGTATGAAQVEAYQLANGSNSFTLGAAAQDVVGGSGVDVINVVDTQLSGAVIDGAAGRDTLTVTSSAPGVSTLAGTIDNIEVIDLTGVANGASFTASAAVEEILAGAGADTLNVSAVTSGANITAGTGADTITGGSGNDTIDVGVDADVDTVNAGGGSDTVTNFGAGDVINFEGGNDTTTYAAVTATVDGGAAVDTLTVTATSGAMSFDFSQVNAQQITAGGTGIYRNFENLTAGAPGVDDALTVIMASTTTAVSTGAGADTITFRSQAVTVDAGSGADTLIMGGSGVIVVDLSAAGDQVSGVGSYAGFENLDGAASGATLVAIAGQNTSFIKTGSGNDSLSGGISLDGGAGNNNITADARTTTVVAGSGNDNLDASVAAQAVTVNLGDGANSVIGSDFDDAITLGAGADEILSGDGSDTVSGAFSVGDSVGLEEGDDTFAYRALGDVSMSVDGGTGSDTLTIGAGSGPMTINFSNSNDQISAEAGSYRNFENLDASTATSGLIVTTAASGGLIVTGSGDDTVTLSALANTTVVTGDGDDIITVTAATINGDIDAGGNTAAGDTLNVLGGGNLSMSVTAVGIENVVLGQASNFTANALSGLKITGSSGNDTITVGAADQIVLSAGGDDVVNVTDALLGATLTVDGGAHTTSDILALTTDASVTDADLAQVTNIEVLRLEADASDNAQSVTLGGNAAAGGIRTVNATLIGANDVLTFDASAFSAALTLNTAAGDDIITLGSGGSVVNAANGNNLVEVGAANDGSSNDNITSGTGADIIVTSSAQLTSDLRITAGGGIDTLRVDDDATVIDGDFFRIAGLEVVQLSADAGDNAQSVVLSANAENAGVTTVDASSAGADDAISVNAASFDLALTVNTGAGDDDIVLGSGGSVVSSGDGADTVTVGASNDGVTNDDIQSGAGADLIKTTDAKLSAALSVQAGGGSDTLEITDDASVVDANLAGLDSVETLKLSANAGDDNQSIVLAANAMAMGLTTLDLTSAGADDNVSVDASAFDNTLLINAADSDDSVVLGSGGTQVNAGNGANEIFVGAGNDGVKDDSISTGSGDDIFHVLNAQFTEHLSISAGGGQDRLQLNSDATVVDGDFALLSAVEVVALNADAIDNAQSVTLASLAAAAGVTSFDSSAAGGNDAVTLDASGFANALTVNTGAGADVITLGNGGSIADAGAGNNTVTVGAVNDSITTGVGVDLIKTTDGRLTGTLSVSAGAGNDTLEVVDDASLVDGDLAQFSSVEVLKLSANAGDNAQSVTLSTNAAAAGVTSVDATGVGADDAVNIDASGFVPALTITSGAGNDSVLLGAAGSVVDAGAGDNTVVVGADNDGVHNDDITTGAGDDLIKTLDARLSSALKISAGDGGDTLQLTDDASVADIDLTQVAGVEVLQLIADAVDNAQSVTLAAQAGAGAFNMIDTTSVGADDVITIDASAFSDFLSVNSGGSDDIVMLGSGGSVAQLGNGANVVTVGAANDGTFNDLIVTGSGADLIKTGGAQLSAELAINAGGGSDTLEITDDAAASDADFAQLQSIETLKLSGDAADNGQSLSLGALAVDAGLSTIDATTAGPNDTITVNAANFTNTLTINTGAGNDQIVLGNGGSVVNAGNGANSVTVGAVNDGVNDDVISTGNGADRVKTTNAQFNANLTINTSGGIDTLEVTDDGTVIDADFAQLSGLEILALSADADDDAQAVTVGAQAAAAGLTTIDTSSAGADDAVTIDASGFANALTINAGAGHDVVLLGAGGSVVDAGEGNNTIEIGAANDGVSDDTVTTGSGNDLISTSDARLSAHLGINAGAGADVLRVTSDASIVDADLAGLLSVETVRLVANAGDDTQSVVLAGNAASAGVTTIDAATAGNDDVIAVDASAFANALTVTTAGGNDIILLGSGGSVVNAGNGNNTVTVGGANDGVHDDHITTGSGADLIKLNDSQLSSHLVLAAGVGSDTLEITDDAAVSDADLANVSSLEILILSADAGDDAQSLTVAANAESMGLNTINALGVGADDDLSIDASGFGDVLEVATGSGNDVVVLGSGGSVVNTNNGDDTITAGSSDDLITAGAGDDIIHVDASTIGATITGGTNTATGDTLNVTGGGTVVMGGSVTQVEKVTLASATNFTANGIAALTITGSAGVDTITVGAADQVVNGAGGDDVIKVSDALLADSLLVDGGADTLGDTLQVSDDATVLDADFTGVSNLEILKLSGDAVDDAQSVTLSVLAAAAGIEKLDTTEVGAQDAVTLDALSFGNALTVNTGAGDDIITLGAGGSVVNAGEGDNTVGIGADNDGVHDDHITTGAGADIFNIEDARLSGNLTIAAGGGIDRMRIISDASVVDADLAGLSGLEVLNLVDDAVDNAQSVVLGANAESAGITTIEGSVGATDAVSIDASAFDNALNVLTIGGDDVIVLGSGGSVVNSGDGADTVTVGAANDGTRNDAITTGEGNDLIRVADAKLTAALSVSAGNGTDTLEVTSDANLVSNELAQIQNVEVLKLSGDAADDAQSVFLGSEANAMGLTTIDATAVAANDVLILNLAATSNALTINGGAAEDHITLGSGGSVVNSGDGIDVVVVGAANDGTFNDNITTGNGSNLVFVTHAQFSSHLVIDAGNGTDGLVMYDDGSVIDADFTNVVSLEQLYFSANAADNAQSVTLAAFAAAAGLNGVYAHLAGANDVITIDASGFANTLDIVTNDAADVITLGGGGSVVDARNGDNTVTVGADNDGVHDDNITTGNGADLIIASDAQLSNHLLIAAGGGVDTLRLTTDASVVDADLAQKTALEIIQLTANAGDDAQSVTLAANAMAAGVTTVDASLAASSDTVTVDASAYTQDLTVILHAGIDDVTLGSGNDVLLGGVSTGDIINLGAGNDSFAITTLAAVTIDGGIDLDSLVIGAGAGSRQIDFSNVVDQLSGLGTYLNFENLAAANANGQLSVIAGDGTTSIVTGSRIDQVDAGLADQGVTIATGASGDAIIGSAHNDSIDGGTGEDSIAGGAGNDALTGGTGSDTFVFDTALNAATNVDTLSDFVSGSDVFQLNLGIFAALESTDGVLNANNFIAGAGAVASNTSQRIILDTTSGSLFYDADGVGGVAQIEFARLGGAHTAVATDFVIG